MNEAAKMLGNKAKKIDSLSQRSFVGITNVEIDQDMKLFARVESKLLNEGNIIDSV